MMNRRGLFGVLGGLASLPLMGWTQKKPPETLKYKGFTTDTGTHIITGLKPGEMYCIVAANGVGKTKLTNTGIRIYEEDNHNR